MFHPFFFCVPDAINWMNNPDWSSLRLIRDGDEANALMRSIWKRPQPVSLANIIVTYESEMTMRRDIKLAAIANVHVEIKPPSPESNNQWQMFIESYVGGDRRMEFGDASGELKMFG